MSDTALEVTEISEQTVDSSSNQPIYSSFSDDPDFAELVEFFVDAIPERIEILREALQQNNIEQIRTASHQLKGAGGGYGFNGLSEHAARLEQASKENNSSAIEEFLEILVDYMSRLSV